MLETLDLRMHEAFIDVLPFRRLCGQVHGREGSLGEGSCGCIVSTGRGTLKAELPRPVWLLSLIVHIKELQ